MRADRRDQVRRPAVVQEEDPLAEAPQRRGAELARPACPWLTPSASPVPMSWTSRSENRFTCWLRSAAIVDVAGREGRRVAERAADVANSVRPSRDRGAPPGRSATARAARGSA